MTDKESILAEHKENVRRNRMKSSGFWKYSTVILLILLIGAIYFNGFSMPTTTSNDAAVDEAVSFINENMLMGLATAEVQDVTEEYGLYKVDLLITSASLDVEEEYTSYITLDGKLLFPTVVDLTELEGTVEETVEEAEEEVVEETADTIDLSGLDLSDENVKGSTDAPVTMIVFSDFECPFCARAYETFVEVEETYGDSLQIIFKNYPLSFHQYAQKAAEAGECANDQGMFWEMHDMMFENAGALTVDDLKSYASAIGLDTDTFNACLDSDEKADEVTADMNEGIALGISGTPTFIINGEMLVGAQPYEAFETAILSALDSVEVVEEAEEEVVEEAEEEVAEEPEAEEEPTEETAEEETTDACGGCEEGTICFNGACVEIAN